MVCSDVGAVRRQDSDLLAMHNRVVRPLGQDLNGWPTLSSHVFFVVGVADEIPRVARDVLPLSLVLSSESKEMAARVLGSRSQVKGSERVPGCRAGFRVQSLPTSWEELE